jgi:hypothetical protein
VSKRRLVITAVLTAAVEPAEVTTLSERVARTLALGSDQGMLAREIADSLGMVESPDTRHGRYERCCVPTPPSSKSAAGGGSLDADSRLHRHPCRSTSSRNG